MALLGVAGSCGTDAARPGVERRAREDSGAQPEPDAGPARDAGETRPDTAAAGSGGVAAPSVPEGPRREVKLRFKAKVFDQDFACGRSYRGVGKPEQEITPVDLRFFVQDLRLVNAAGRAVPVTFSERAPWQVPGVALIDLADQTGACKGSPEMNDVIEGTVPEGEYTGLQFSNGVPEALNHGDPLKHPPPLQATDLTWGWLTGFKFFVAEVETLGGGDEDAGEPMVPGGGLLHVGAASCSSEGPATLCRVPNRNLVRFRGFDPDRHVIVVDVGLLFLQSDLRGGLQCHSDVEDCAELFQRVGLQWGSGERLTAQTVYRLE